MKINNANLKFAYNPGARSLTTHTILHHAAGNGTVESIHNGHLSRGWAGIAYHYYVRKDGTIWQGRPENWSGGHTQNYNHCAIGICAEGNFEDEAMSQVQALALAELVGEIRIRYPGIVVCRHRDLNATKCPGRNYPFDDIVSPKTQEPVNADVESKTEPDKWAAAACDKAVTAGIFKGDDKGDFRWHFTPTRQEIAVILERAGLYDGCKCKEGK